MNENNNEVSVNESQVSTTPIEENVQNTKKKKFPFVIIFLILLVFAGYFFFSNKDMFLNDEKNCIEVGTLLKLKNKYNLTVDFEKYGEIIYGITYKEQDKKIRTQYFFEEREKAYNYIVDNGMKLTPAVYSNDKIESIISNCRINNIPLTQEIISCSWEEYQLYSKKIRNIRRIQNCPTKEGIHELFELLPGDEIKK